MTADPADAVEPAGISRYDIAVAAGIARVTTQHGEQIGDSDWRTLTIPHASDTSLVQWALDYDPDADLLICRARPTPDTTGAADTPPDTLTQEQ